jgi:hypothetical protein
MNMSYHEIIPEKPPLKSSMIIITIKRKPHVHNRLLTTTKSEHQVESALLLNIVIR